MKKQAKTKRAVKKQGSKKMSTKTNKTRVSRRGFLRGATAAAAGLPFLKSFEASAQDGPKPKLIIFASGSSALVGPTGGSGYQGWLPSSLHSGSGFAERPMSGTLPSILEPLTRHSGNLIAIDGLHGSDRVGPHQHAPVLLTGGGINNGERPRSAGGDGEFHADTRSIDHAIAEAIDSRVLGMAYNIDGFQRGEGFLSHTAAGRPYIPIQNPVEAFDRVFGSGSSSMGSAGTLMARRRSVLDALRGDVRALQRRLPGADRASLEQHLTSIRSIEEDLMDPPSVSCESGTRPDGFDARNSANFPRLMRSYMQTMVQGLRCGYTRIGFLQAGNLEGSMRPQWDEFGIRTSYNEHAINHKFVGEDGAGSAGLSRAEAVRLGVGLNQAYNSLYADLLDALAETPDVDGSPMLDHTMVLQVKPMGRNHDSRHLFWTLAGGAGLGIRTGRFVRLDRGGNKHYINDLLVAIAQKMGATGIRQFGRGSQNREAFPLG